MTSIVFYQNGSMPTFHADTLLTSGVPMNGRIKTPQWGESGREMDRRYAVGLCQKIVIITNRLAYVWAGNLSVIIDFDRRLRLLVQERGEQEAFNLSNSLAAEFEKQGIDVGIIYKRNENENEINLVGFDKVQLPRFGELYMAGSGAGSWFGDMGRVSSDLPFEIKVDDIQDKSISDMIVRWQIIESVIEFAILNGNYDNVSTGEIVETLVMNSQIIKKVQNTVFVIWDERLPFHYGMFLFQMIRRFYYEDYLCVSFIDNSTMRNDCFIIPPPHLYNSHIDVPAIMFNPFYDTPDRVACIFIRKNNTVSHFSESGAIFMKNMAYNPQTRGFIVSDWYYKDMKEKAIQSELIARSYRL